MLKRNIYLMYAIALLQGMVFYGPIATLYRQAQGVSFFQITIIESCSLALCLLLELPWGIVADKLGYRRTMVFCCGLYFVSKLVFWQASGFGGFLLERLMLSVVMAGLSGVDTSILFLSVPEGQSQRVFGIYNYLSTAGLLFAALVYSLCIGDSYRTAGFLTVLSYGVAAVLALGLTEVRRPQGEERAGAFAFLALLRGVFKKPRLLLLLAGVALLNETHQTVTVFLSQLQYQRCGVPNATIGLLYIGMTVTGMVGVSSARLTQWLGARRLGALLYLGGAAACLLLAFTRSGWLSALCLLALRAVFSIFQPLQTELQNRQVRTLNRATALSINAVLIESVGIGTNLGFGKLAQGSLPAALLLGCGLCLVGLVCFLLWQRRGAENLAD